MIDAVRFGACSNAVRSAVGKVVAQRAPCAATHVAAWHCVGAPVPPGQPYHEAHVLISMREWSEPGFNHIAAERCFAETELWPGGCKIDSRNVRLWADGGKLDIALMRLKEWAHEKCKAALTLVIKGYKSELDDSVFALFPNIRYLQVNDCDRVTQQGLGSLKLMETLHVVNCKHLSIIQTRVIDMLVMRHALRYVKWCWDDKDTAPINVFSKETDLAALHTMGAVGVKLIGTGNPHYMQFATVKLQPCETVIISIPIKRPTSTASLCSTAWTSFAHHSANSPALKTTGSLSPNA